MAEESEKRFHAIMDKLFKAPPKSKSTTPSQSTSSPRVQMSKGKKRPNMESALSVLEPKSRRHIVEGLQKSLALSRSVQAPLCRPWDRGDLMRRLATFKSMTWFAKPQVVSPVNCARRGWVNVDMDTIACEACHARIFFSTPTSWTQHQVEKAALVFSLKLDNGHKLLCPWIDNACDETLAQFPPAPAIVLVDEFKKRSSALLNLLALPVISSSAIDYMRSRSPQLEHFLRGSSTLGCGNESADTSQTESVGNENETKSSVSYYQAQKLISLCGWEPRLLPYVVDCKNRQNQPSRDANLVDLSREANEHNSSIVVYSSGMDDTMEASDDAVASSGLQSDPNSVVLDCRLCGASVGLWTFYAVPRPLELLRVVGYTEVNGEDNPSHHKDGICGDVGAYGSHDLALVNHDGEGTFNAAPTSATSARERQLNLKFSIAGGPPPTKQNFRATISLPVIGRNLRARISSDLDFRDQCQGGKNHRVDTLNEQGLQPEDAGLLSDTQVNDGQCNSKSNEQLSCSNNDISEQGNVLGNGISSEGDKSSGQGPPEISTPDSVMENPIQSTPNVVDGFTKNDTLPENVDNVATGSLTMGVGNSSQDGELSAATVNATIRNWKILENDSSTAGVNNSQVGELSAATTDVNATIRNGDILENDTSITPEDNANDQQQNPAADTVCGTHVDTQDGSGVEAMVQSVNNDVEQLEPHCIEKNLHQLPSDKAMEFDPIRQHRHFCPWIASIGNSLPGWQQTLSALQRQKEFDCPLSPSPPSSSLIEVDDPIASVKKLFTSPSAKRMKLIDGSR